MNPPRATPDDYIAFLVATPGEGTATEMGRCQPTRPNAPAHDAFTRLLNRLEPDADELWREVRPLLPAGGVLVFDDTVLDKPHAEHMGLVGRFWSGRHRRVVQGIDLVTAVWTDGDGLWPCDYRLVDPAEAPKRTKNDHLRDMLAAAKGRGLAPACVAFDCWFSGLDNLKAVRGHGWVFLTQVRCNRRVNPDRAGNRSISECAIAATGTVVHLEGFGLVKAFRIVAPNGDTEHWITNDLGMDEGTRLGYAERAWGIEAYHRGLKQHTAVARCQTRQANAQRNHIGFALRAFVRLEWHRFTTGVSWFAAKLGIIREAVRGFLTQPAFGLPQWATA
ncbi:MAG TPA: transposase [Fimbriiglobus sp.]|nr:transposase [Fimbriiglobus sp.]